MDEFLVESCTKDADEVGQLMCEAYKYASEACYKWHKNNPDLFGNSTPVLFPFNLDGGFKVGNTYLATH
tara:strand:- start:3477 stop:3683 length:207 start_codon:yes stop_codon:yes gene_type:complete